MKKIEKIEIELVPVASSVHGMRHSVVANNPKELIEKINELVKELNKLRREK